MCIYISMLSLHILLQGFFNKLRDTAGSYTLGTGACYVRHSGVLLKMLKCISIDTAYVHSLSFRGVMTQCISIDI